MNLPQALLNTSNIQAYCRLVYKYLIKDFLWVPTLCVYVLCVGIIAKADSIDTWISAMAAQALYLAIAVGVIITCYIFMFVQQIRAKSDELLNLPLCSDIELDILLYSMKQKQCCISRYADFTSIIQSNGNGHLTNMTIIPSSEDKGPTSIVIKPNTFRYLTKNRGDIESLMERSLAKSHLELRAGGGSLTISMMGDNHSLAKFRDALQRLQNP